MNVDDLSEECCAMAKAICECLDDETVEALSKMSDRANFLTGLALGLAIGRGDIPNPVYLGIPPVSG